MHSYCSPSKKNTIQDNSCYNSDELISIINAYNKHIKNEILCNKFKCVKPELILIKNKSVKQLYQELYDKLSELCDKEYCWLDLPFINNIKDKRLKESILYFTFKPKGLETKRTWFNTMNINEIMQQYQDLYKDFKFLGAQPSDYTKIKKLNKSDLKHNSRYLGIIFNTDPHTKPGQHWIAVFIDNHTKRLDYFDSLGHVPTKNIASFLKLFKDYHFNINRKEHQKGGTNCGVYSCFFIIQRLNGNTFHNINKKITDKMMTDYRDILFRPK